MTSLVACLSNEAGASEYVRRLAENDCWEQVFIVTTPEAKEGFSCERDAEYIVLSKGKDVMMLSDDIKDALSGKLSGFDAAVSLISGTGKMHIAVLSALLKMGLGLRLVHLKDNEVVEV